MRLGFHSWYTHCRLNSLPSPTTSFGPEPDKLWAPVQKRTRAFALKVANGCITCKWVSISSFGPAAVPLVPSSVILKPKVRNLAR